METQMETRQDENLIPISELEKILDIHRNTITEWIRDGTLPQPKVRRRKKQYWFWWQIREFVNKPSLPVCDNSSESTN